MIFGVLLFLLSVHDTDTFEPFPSGYTCSETEDVVSISVEQSEGFFSVAPGDPFLPLVSRVYILPGRCEVLSVSASLDHPLSTETLHAPLAGAPVVLPVGEYTGQRLEATTGDLLIEEMTVIAHTGHILDAYTIVSCSVNPWVYNSDKRELGLSPSCTVELEWMNIRERSDLSQRQIDMINFRTASIADKYGTSFEQIPALPGSDASVDYLIITGEDFVSDVTLLENQLDAKGLSFQTLTVQDINGNWDGIDVQEDIRNCIRHYAFNQGTTYVLLAGDETVIPTRDVYTECEGHIEFAPSDLYYADLDGSWDANGNGIYGEWADSLDLYADVLLGRLLFSSTAGANAIFEKNAAYANVSSSETWFKQAVLCGAMLFDSIGYVGAKGCEIMAQEFPYEFAITKAYELSVGDYPDTYFPVLYSGAGWNHYAGHGNDRGIYWASNGEAILNISRMNGFSNPDRAGIHSSIGCHVGDFTDPGVCLPDTLLRLPDGGGVAGLFNTSWGWEGYWPEIGSSERLCNFTVTQVYQNKASSLGLAFTSANDLEIPNMTGPYDRVMQSVIAYSAFMDPSLEVLGVSSFDPLPPSPFQVVVLSTNPHINGELSFKITGVSNSYDVTIYNLAGRVIRESVNLPRNTLRSVDVSSLPVGIYFVSAAAPSGLTASGSFVVLR